MENPTRRGFLTAGAAALAGMGCLTASSSQPVAAGPTPRRNVIFILIDDQRFDALGIAGHPFLQTPHLDALARNGVLFENAFVTTSLCSPSRATILTGQYAHRHGVLDNTSPFPPGLATFPELLQRSGYSTAFIGKWHMGGASDSPRPGFDHWVSFKGQGVYDNPTLNVNGQSVTKDGGYITDVLTDYAEEFIKRPHTQPFFMFLAHKAVHSNFTPPQRYKGCYSQQTYPRPASMADTEANYRGKPAWVRAQRGSFHGVEGMYDHVTDYDTFTRNYAETMRGVDDSIGRLTAALREQGLLESTLIVYTSDNGFMFGEHGLIDKRAMYEASIRIPLIAHCPDMFPAGSRRKEMITNLDFAPTLLEAAGVPAPESMQGLSFLDLASGKPVTWRDAFLYEYFWERSFPHTPSVLGVRTDRYKYMKYHGIWDRYELYDLEEDPDELRNLLGDFIQGTDSGPLEHRIQSRSEDPGLRKLFKEMEGHLSRLLEETGCREEPTWGKPMRG